MLFYFEFTCITKCNVDEKTLLLRDKERPEDCRMNERCISLLNNFKNKNYNKQNILDTSNIAI